MTFLQPFIFWALPLILLPVLIHFLNRMRHKPQPWAAMRFLISATRSSVSNTKLRQFLIMLFRVLALVMLLLFLARPLAGGWLGWALSPAPDAIIILLDRSASMETKIGPLTKREQALQLLSQAAKEFEESSHLVLIDSATRAPQEVAKAANLTQLSVTQPTDTAADIPAMLSAAFNWLIENRAGTAEIWIASDAQRSNWQPEDPRWKSIIAQISSLSQKVRVRLINLSQAPELDNAIALKELVRRQRADKSELQFVLDLQRNRNGSAPIPVTMNLDGAKSQSEISLEGQTLRWRNKVELGNRPSGGWGSFELPTDANSRDNTAYFVYGADLPLQASVISSSAPMARFLQYAAAGRMNQPADLILPADFTGANLTNRSLLIWQEALPTGDAAERLQNFAREGGVVIFFPPDKPDAQQFNGLSWGAVQEAEPQSNFRVLRWEEDEGPLAKSDEHFSLPLSQTTFQRRQAITGQKNILAAFEDGAAFLTRQSMGKGEIYFCTSLPSDNWSSLSDGPVLVPMLQRMMQSGARRLQQVSSIICGELSAVDQGKEWTSVDSTDHKNIRIQAGVYKSGDRLLAVNRPTSEDEPEILDQDETKKLFGDLPLQTFQEKRVETSALQGEVWRIFVFAMLFFLIGEAILILPSRPEEKKLTGREKPA